jgi:hypothetical protein
VKVSQPRTVNRIVWWALYSQKRNSFNHTTGKPVKQFKFGDLASPTYHALVSKVMSMMSILPNADVDLNQSDVTLRYEGSRQDWMVDIETNEGLLDAIDEKRKEGFIMITAHVVDKDVPIVIKTEPPMAASANIPTHASAGILTHPSASFPTYAPASIPTLPTHASGPKSKPQVAKKKQDSKPCARIPTHASDSIPTHASAGTPTYASASIPIFPTHASVPKPKPQAAKKKQVSKPRAKPHGRDKTIPVHERILSAMAELLALKIPAPPRIQVAFFSGYTNANTGFVKALSQMKKQGLVEYSGKATVRLSLAGLAKAGTVDLPRSTADVHKRIKDLFPPKAQEFINYLSDGSTHPREDVATACGYDNEASTGFAKVLSNLKGRGIVEYLKDPADSKKKLVRLTDISFPFGRGDNTAPTINVEPAAVRDETMESDSTNSDY